MPIVLNGKTYNFIGFDANGVSTYKESSASSPTGFSYLTSKVTQAQGNNDAVVRWRLTMPIVAADDSTCGCMGTVLRTYRYDEGKLTLPNTGLSAEREDFAARVGDLVASVQYIASVEDLIQPSS